MFFSSIGYRWRIIIINYASRRRRRCRRQCWAIVYFFLLFFFIDNDPNSCTPSTSSKRTVDGRPAARCRATYRRIIIKKLRTQIRHARVFYRKKIYARFKYWKNRITVVIVVTGFGRGARAHVLMALEAAVSTTAVANARGERASTSSARHARTHSATGCCTGGNIVGAPVSRYWRAQHNRTRKTSTVNTTEKANENTRIIKNNNSYNIRVAVFRNRRLSRFFRGCANISVTDTMVFTNHEEFFATALLTVNDGNTTDNRLITDYDTYYCDIFPEKPKYDVKQPGFLKWRLWCVHEDLNRLESSRRSATRFIGKNAVVLPSRYTPNRR